MNAIRNEARALAAAVIFFTRVPLRLRGGPAAADLARAATWLPAIGWLAGAVAAGVWWLAALVWPPAVAAGVSLAATLLLTGALHEDGWADVCDGFGGGATRERVLEIMRDSRIGAFGAIGLVVMLGLKWRATAALPPSILPMTLIAGHALSRAAAVSLMATMDYARETGKAKPLAVRLGAGRLAIALGCGVLPLTMLPARFWWAAVAVLAVRLLLARWFACRIGGYTGDALGAAQQLGELAFYLTVLACA